MKTETTEASRISIICSSIIDFISSACNTVANFCLPTQEQLEVTTGPTTAPGNTGEQTDGKKHGEGTCTHPNGDTYTGELADDKINGEGTYTYSDGRKYTGEWAGDKRHGQGTYTYPSGDTYIGEWADDNINGKGTFTFRNGQEYTDVATLLRTDF